MDSKTKGFVVLAKETEIVKTRLATASAKVIAFNDAVVVGNATAIKVAEEEYKTAIDELNDEILNKVYLSFMLEPNPVEEMLKGIFVEGLYAKRNVKDTKAIELRDDVIGVLDLRAMEKATSKQLASSAAWFERVKNVYNRLNLRSSNGLDAMTMEAAKAKFHIVEGPDFVGIPEEVLLNGKKTTVSDPLSNNSTVAAIQGVVDAMIFIDNGAGLNKFKADNRTLNYLEKALYTDVRGKAYVGLTGEKKNQTLITKFTKAVHIIVTGGKYVLDTPDLKD